MTADERIAAVTVIQQAIMVLTTLWNVADFDDNPMLREEVLTLITQLSSVPVLLLNCPTYDEPA